MTATTQASCTTARAAPTSTKTSSRYAPLCCATMQRPTRPSAGLHRVQGDCPKLSGRPRRRPGTSTHIPACPHCSTQSALEPEAAGGPVLATGPNDHVFVYYADHGAPGILGMPWGPFLYADQLISTLEKKTKAKYALKRTGLAGAVDTLCNRAFKEMVLFIEACESGSMFEGLLNAELPIYVTTAANAHESSWGTYCPGMAPSPAPEFTTCLGDLYSVAWLEEVYVHVVDILCVCYGFVLDVSTCMLSQTDENFVPQGYADGQQPAGQRDAAHAVQGRQAAHQQQLYLHHGQPRDAVWQPEDLWGDARRLAGGVAVTYVYPGCCCYCQYASLQPALLCTMHGCLHTSRDNTLPQRAPGRGCLQHRQRTT